MANEKLKLIMTDLAAGHITKKQADEMIEGLKVAREGPEDPQDASEKEVVTKNNTHKRKKPTKSKEVNK